MLYCAIARDEGIHERNEEVLSMDETKSGEMYKYYNSKAFSPTSIQNDSHDIMQRYEDSRKFLFRKLKMPPRLFKQAELIEFGPDTGENTCLFAKWGSQVFVVEPNETSMDTLLENFDRFGFSDRISGTSNVSLQDFSSNKSFDLLVAEGFIHTIQPNQLWIKKCASLLRPDGLMLMSYMETAGHTFEILLKVIYRYGVEVLQDDSINTAHRLFDNKWDSIPHTRTFHSWYMDVIKNPYVRYQYLNHAHDLLASCEKEALFLYSSWPIYEDGLHVAWHKAKEMGAERQNRLSDNIKRSKLSYLFGEKCYYTGSSETQLEVLIVQLETLVRRLDEQVEGTSKHLLQECYQLTESVLGTLEQQIFFCHPGGLNRCIQKLMMLQDVLSLMLLNKPGALFAMCAENPVFINTWGMANHIAVFQKQIDRT